MISPLYTVIALLSAGFVGFMTLSYIAYQQRDRYHYLWEDRGLTLEELKLDTKIQKEKLDALSQDNDHLGLKCARLQDRLLKIKTIASGER